MQAKQVSVAAFPHKKRVYVLQVHTPPPRVPILGRSGHPRRKRVEHGGKQRLLLSCPTEQGKCLHVRRSSTSGVLLWAGNGHPRRRKVENAGQQHCLLLLPRQKVNFLHGTLSSASGALLGGPKAGTRGGGVEKAGQNSDACIICPREDGRHMSCICHSLPPRVPVWGRKWAPAGEARNTMCVCVCVALRAYQKNNNFPPRPTLRLGCPVWERT